MSTSINVQRVSLLTDIDNNTYIIQCIIDTQPDATDINGFSVAAILINSAYVSSIIASDIRGNELTGTCNWNINGGIFKNTTTAKGIP